ncbi:bifunctional 4-alpha-glucanotransferase/amylo-alpha-1,6-glucosidase, partial [Oleoguttula sp. CCFEE 5521]
MAEEGALLRAVPDCTCLSRGAGDFFTRRVLLPVVLSEIEGSDGGVVCDNILDIGITVLNHHLYIPPVISSQHRFLSSLVGVRNCTSVISYTNSRSLSSRLRLRRHPFATAIGLTGHRPRPATCYLLPFWGHLPNLCEGINNHTVHLLPLKDDGSPDLAGDPAYCYLPPPTKPAYSVRFEFEGTSSICRQGSLWHNLPNEGERFVRSRFREHKLKASFNDVIQIDVPVHQAGAFEFYTTYTPIPKFTVGRTEVPQSTSTKTFYIDVEPHLQVGKSRLPLD